MRKADSAIHAEYKCSDHAKLKRGKFVKEAFRGTTVALIEPSLTEVFPTSETVNEAPRGLLSLTNETARITGRSKRISRKWAAV